MAVLAGGLLSSTPAEGQTSDGNWTLPRTPDGHPDLQGNWSNATMTPMVRPPGVGPVLTPEQVAALESGRLAAAALDVFASEPLVAASPLLAAPNLVLTPHIGSASLATRTRMGELAVENLLAGLDGRPMPHCANPEFAESGRG